MEYKSIISTKEVEGRRVTGFAAIFGNIDLGADRIHKGAFKKTIKEGMDHIRHLWQHESGDPPIATIIDLQEVSQSKLPDTIKDKFPEATGGLLVEREYLDTPRGEEVLQGIVKGAINEMSFAYDPIKYDFEEIKGQGQLVRNLRELRLFDISDVNWGMNPATVASKSAVQYKDTGKDDGEWVPIELDDFTKESWEVLSEAEKSRVREHYAYAGQDAFDGLKFAHHRVTDSGVGPVVWKGVAIAMTELMKPGCDIPDTDRKGIYDHLAEHYKQFDKAPPDFNFIEAISKTLALTDVEIASGLAGYFNSRVDEIGSLFANLKELLIKAEPWEADKANPALTRITLQRLEIITNQIKTI